jgi:hypothetical protein
MNTRVMVPSFAEVPQSGTYQCGNCFNAERRLDAGTKAPLCANCKREVSWLLLRLVSDDDEKRNKWPLV